MWDYRYGGGGEDQLYDFQRTSDGGYILGGASTSRIGGDKTEDNYDTIYPSTLDFWIVKIDSMQNIMWNKVYGGTAHDQLTSLQQTSDGGFILGGYSISYINGNKSDTLWGNYDYWIVKIDPLGNKQWDMDFGGSMEDKLYVIRETADKNYILGGTSRSGISGNKTTSSWGISDFWILKVDSLGNKLWEKNYGGYGWDQLYCLEQTADKGYILGGGSTSGIGGDKTQDTCGREDCWIVKIDSAGNKQWDKDFGGTGGEAVISIIQTSDNGYILGATSNSLLSCDHTQGTWGEGDYWILKTDSLGYKLWDKNLGGTGNDELRKIIQTSDGGYLISGDSYSSIGGNKSENNLGLAQTWVVKTDSLGNILWDQTILSGGRDIQGLAIQNNSSCYTFATFDNGGIAGYRTQTNWGGYDYWIIKFCDSTLTTNSPSIEKEIVQLLLSPNPTEGKFNISGLPNEERQIEIYNTLGEKVYSVPVNRGSQQTVINIESLPPGVYFVKVGSADKILTQKLILY